MEANDTEPLCAEEQSCTTLRFVLIMFASVVADFGLVTNSALIWIFLRLHKREGGTSARLYSAALSVFDVLLCITFVMLFQFDVLAIYLRWKFCQFVVFETLCFVFVMSKMVQVCIPYYIIIATLERWAVVSRFRETYYVRLMTTTAFRCVLIVMISISAFALKIPNAWAYYMHQFPNCTDYFRVQEMHSTGFLENHKGFKDFDFYGGAALQLFIPFVVLLVCNAAIVTLIKREAAQHHSTANSFIHENNATNNESVVNNDNDVTMVMLNDGKRTAEDLAEERAVELRARHSRQRIREITTTITVIVSTYLLCNIPHLVLTVLEYFEPETRILYLYVEGVTDAVGTTSFYSVYSDIVSVLFMSQSFLRFAIYCACNQAVRNEIKALFLRTKS